MTSNSPLISVVLPVYNGSNYLSESIKSILNQSYNNIELILINDGSIDNSEQIILKIHDNRIRYFKQSNQGLATTLNNGITYARGEFIVRHDQDDIAKPDRIHKQFNFLIKNKSYAMVGTWAEIWNENGTLHRYHKHPADNLILKFLLLFSNPFVHSSVMFIKKNILDLGGYSTDTKRQPPEDYELWSRVAKNYKIANIPEVLQTYREIPSSMSRQGITPFANNQFSISLENINNLIANNKYFEHAKNFLYLVYHEYSKINEAEFSTNDLYIFINKLAHSIIINEINEDNANSKKLNNFVYSFFNKLKKDYVIYKKPYLKLLLNFPILSRLI